MNSILSSKVSKMNSVAGQIAAILKMVHKTQNNEMPSWSHLKYCFTDPSQPSLPPAHYALFPHRRQNNEKYASCFRT